MISGLIGNLFRFALILFAAIWIASIFNEFWVGVVVYFLLGAFMIKPLEIETRGVPGLLLLGIGIGWLMGNDEDNLKTFFNDEE